MASINDENDVNLILGAEIVEEIRASVYKETGFRCSAGISLNKVIILYIFYIISLLFDYIFYILYIVTIFILLYIFIIFMNYLHLYHFLYYYVLFFIKSFHFLNCFEIVRAWNLCTTFKNTPSKYFVIKLYLNISFLYL